MRDLITEYVQPLNDIVYQDHVRLEKLMQPLKKQSRRLFELEQTLYQKNSGKGQKTRFDELQHDIDKLKQGQIKIACDCRETYEKSEHNSESRQKWLEELNLKTNSCLELAKNLT